jgi:hypothetical protein
VLILTPPRGGVAFPCFSLHTGCFQEQTMHKEAVRRFANRPRAGFLQKPYTSRRLAEKVKAVLEASGQ